MRDERRQALAGRALALEPAARSEFLAHETRGDDDLHGEVLALIAAYDRSPSPSSRRPGNPTPDWSAADDVRWVGRQVGPWRVTRCIGRGGMGTVCEANRADAQFEKRVAIKFLRRQAREPGAVQRFRAERQMLASLEHPNVATLLDGGVTTDGRPYLVMEYVDGDPITVWAQTHRLGRRRRVELFLQVCAAVEAAHRQLIVHRDLKPGNVLVTRDGPSSCWISASPACWMRV